MLISGITTLSVACALLTTTSVAQQWIPLTRSSCSSQPPSETKVACHWSNSNMTCTWNYNTYKSAHWSCSSDSCAQDVQSHLVNGQCVTTTITDCCAASIEMNSSCSNAISPTMTETTVTVPGCNCTAL